MTLGGPITSSAKDAKSNLLLKADEDGKPIKPDWSAMERQLGAQMYAARARFGPFKSGLNAEREHLPAY
eukprot:6599088-Lingulodinium_polyedra.AAC.1